MQSSGEPWPSAFFPVENQSVSPGEGLLGSAVPFPPFTDLPKGGQGHFVLRETDRRVGPALHIIGVQFYFCLKVACFFNEKYDKEKHKQKNSCGL